MDLKPYIRDIADFPTPGILFKDITPLLTDPKAFKYVVDCFVERYSNSPIDSIVGIEARFTIFGQNSRYIVRGCHNYYGIGEVTDEVCRI